MSAAPASVLIVRLSSIGDVVHTIPAYMALQRSWPESRFGWAVESAAAELVRRLPGNLRVHELDIQRWRRTLLSGATRQAVRQRLGEIRQAGYELAIDFQGLIKSALVARSARTAVLGFARGDLRESLAARLYHRTAPPTGQAGHMVLRNLGLAQAAGATAARPEYPPLCDSDDASTVAQQLGALASEPFVMLHTAANWPSKSYADERFVAIARTLHQRCGLPVLWIWGPGEHDRVHQMADSAGAGSHLAPSTSLPQLVALLERAALFIGGDSAPLHLAGACGTPVVGVFGPTDPARLGPLDPEDEVVCEVLECSHCHRRQCPLGTGACLATLAPEAIVEAALRRLAAGRRNRA